MGPDVKALCWYGKHDVRVKDVPEPTLVNPQDAIVRVPSTAICGSDLHLYDAMLPGLRPGDILGHEFMGIVEEVGPSVEHLHTGDRVVVPAVIACGACQYCLQQMWSLCDNTNPNARLLEVAYGASGAALFGYTHLFGGYPGGQAEYVRVPFADVGPIKVPGHLSDEQVLFLSDILPTGYMAAEQCGIRHGDIVAVWGCGPVGQFAIKSALLLGAHTVIAIDHLPSRLRTAQAQGADTIDFGAGRVHDELMERTAGRGPDACIDAVGLELHATGGFGARYDRAKQMAGMGTDRLEPLRQAILACRKGGTVSVPGMYGGLLDKVPFGAAFAKGLTLRMGPTHMQRYMAPLLARIERGELDPGFVITHEMPLTEAPEAYALFHEKADACLKIVLKPN